MSTVGRFLALVDRTPDDQPGCWLWQGCLNKSRYGYGYIYVDGQMQLAHRLAWQMAYGEIPAGMQVHHRCDNPRCVRPDHLWIGVQKENHADMMRKGRHAYALNPAIAAEIRRLRTEGFGYRRIAKMLGIGRSATVHVAAGRTWSEAA
jgi:hypothetical protein